MKSWVKFFVGTPKRFFCTFVGLAFLLAMVSKTAFAFMMQTIVSGVEAILPLVITVALIILGAKILWKKVLKM